MNPEKAWEKVTGSREFDEFYFFAIALILAFGTLQTTGTVFDTDKPVVTVVSCSMYPEYDVGDILVVKGQDYEDIERGDIVVYRTEEMNIPVVHRVIEKNPGYLETQGDNNQGQLDFEENVTPDQIHGTTAFKIPRVGLVKLLAMDLAGFSGDAPLVLDAVENCRVRS